MATDRTAAASAAQETDGYSSPACYAHEIAPDYFGEPPTMPAEQLVRLLNVLLEAERAGARVLAAFLNEYERDTPAWRQLAAVQRDEANNCSILIDLIRRVTGTPSAATGDFLGKALAVEGKAARLQFLKPRRSVAGRRKGHRQEAPWSIQEGSRAGFEPGIAPEEGRASSLQPSWRRRLMMRNRS
jgi:hypothetical protein